MHILERLGNQINASVETLMAFSPDIPENHLNTFDFEINKLTEIANQLKTYSRELYGTIEDGG